MLQQLACDTRWSKSLSEIFKLGNREKTLFFDLKSYKGVIGVCGQSFLYLSGEKFFKVEKKVGRKSSEGFICVAPGMNVGK